MQQGDEEEIEGVIVLLWLKSGQFIAILVCKLCNIPNSRQFLTWVSLYFIGLLLSH